MLAYKNCFFQEKIELKIMADYQQSWEMWTVPLNKEINFFS
jgi:hypothetical protein